MPCPFKKFAGSSDHSDSSSSSHHSHTKVNLESDPFLEKLPCIRKCILGRISFVLSTFVVIFCLIEQFVLGHTVSFTDITILVVEFILEIFLIYFVLSNYMFKPLDKIVKRIPFVPKSREIAYFKQEFERIDYERIYSDSIIRTSMDGIITISETGILETFNAGAQRIFGYTEAETIGKNIKMLMPEPYQSEHDSYLAHYVETGEKKVIGYEREAMGRRKDGSTFPIYLYVGEVYFKDKRIFTGIVRDVSDLKKSQEKIMRTSEAQASGIKQINHSMQTIGHNQRGISTKIEEITKLSNSCFEQVESGFKLVQNNLEKMEAIKTENEQALVKIRTLNDQIVKISDVVGIINSIADQTKIIAFNAELEASSAGEAGKNFQIVASEIRRLADNTVTSTKEIKAKIAEIQGSSDQLVLVVEKGTKNITEGYSITNSLKDIFATIRQTTEVSNQSMGNIQKSVEEQNISSNEVLSELERIAQI